MNSAGNEPDYRVLFESAPGLYLVLSPDPSFTIIAVSNAYANATMTQREQIIGRGIFDVFPDNPEDIAATGASNLRASLNKVLDRFMPDTMAIQKYDIRRPEAEGGSFEERYWSPINMPVIDQNGEIRYIIHRVEDVTEFVRLKNEEIQKEKVSEETLARANRAEAELYSRERELEKAREVEGELERRVAERSAELAKIQEDFYQAQKLEAVGRLSGGIAHDFNNLLTGILGITDDVRKHLGPESPFREDLDAVIKAGEKASSLTRQLLAFGRRQVVTEKVFNVNSVIVEMSRMFQRTLGEDVELVAHLDPRLGSIRADQGHIEQVVVNLILNARDAMPHGGKIILATTNVELDEEYAKKHLDIPPGPYVSLKISDSGMGISHDIMNKIFEPFFTTKEQGKGTGLGLSTVYGILKQNHGDVSVYSELGKGTTFQIYLPRVANVVEVERRQGARGVGPGGTETILIVEDEDIVRRVVVKALRRRGYTVLEAAGGKEAVALVNDLKEPLHLLVTDVVMPGMNGKELVDQLAKDRPHLPVLYMSGHPQDIILDRGMLDIETAFIEKAFSADAFCRKVREVLDAGGKVRGGQSTPI